MKLRPYFNLMIVLLLAFLTACSVYGAFQGAQDARAFFNSTPMAVFWMLLLGLLIIGFFFYVSLRRRLWLTLIHAGCIFVLAGGMYGSEKGHVLTSRFFQKQAFTKGMIALRQGQASDRVILGEGEETAQLPFHIQLKEAYIEYYDEAEIIFYLNAKTHYSIPIQVGHVFTLPNGEGTITLDAAYKNFKMTQQDGLMKPYDSPEPGLNPAYELTYTPKDQPPQHFFVFERFGMHALPGITFKAEFAAPRMIKDYKSTLQVVEKDKVVQEMTIEVNKPLYYGGYHFYQNTFRYDQWGPVSGIMVTSASGVWCVFGGYAMIFAGLVLHFGSKLFTVKLVAVRKDIGVEGTNGH